MTKIISSLAAISLVISGSAFAAGNAAAGKAKTATCVACHGPAGMSTVPMYPNLAGQHAQYLAKQIRAFKSGERKDPSMAPMVKALSDQDILDIAAYYESLGKSGASEGGTKKRRRR